MGHIKKVLLILLIFTLLHGIIGCKQENNSIENTENLSSTSKEKEIQIVYDNEGEEAANEINEQKEEKPGGKGVNSLTGLWIDESIVSRRPVAVVINNIRKALPQSGISQAGVIYETLAEGEITRLIALFKDFNAKKIGPLRSARHYFIDFALNHDAVFVHHGVSPLAATAIKNLKPANLDSLSHLEKTLSWRDSTRRKQRGMFEHSLYTNTEKILKTWNTVGYRMNLKESYLPMFVFSEKDWTPIGSEAKKVTIHFSKVYVPEFYFDNETGLYLRNQFGKPHIDEYNGEQLSVKNIFILFTDIWTIKGDDAFRRDMNLITSGTGKYITNGRAIPITWSRKSNYSPYIFKDIDGNILEINKGKTWICIFPKNNKIEIR
ncbi:MAG: hypothetical protein COA82_00120 [Alkaliphilus sp.]|nr:DUF3048 domain-containing protein [bacterium AH-315-G05]PHS36420.1 MAG: hypothetical protein COA82_00120 [Alkaliphilus sp.]